MIKNYKQYIKESLLDHLEGPTKEELWKGFGYDKVFNTLDEFLDEICKHLTITYTFYNNKRDLIVFSSEYGKHLFDLHLDDNRLIPSYNYVEKIIVYMFPNVSAEDVKDKIKTHIYNSIGDIKIDFEVEWEPFMFNEI